MLNYCHVRIPIEWSGYFAQQFLIFSFIFWSFWIGGIYKFIVRDFLYFLVIRVQLIFVHVYADTAVL